MSKLPSHEVIQSCLTYSRVAYFLSDQKRGSVEVISTDSKHQLLCKISSSNPKEIIVDDMMQAYVWFQYYKYDNTKHHEVEQRTIYKQSTCQRWAVN